MNESSPLFLDAPNSLRRSDAGFVLNMSGTDETTGQTIQYRTSFQAR